jgi:O2-independent ubiquinone biosynthesis accessory factor UbiT
MRGSLPPLVGRLAAFVPLVPLEMALRHLIARAIAMRPGFGARMAEYAGKRFAIDPVDCPFAFLITPQADGVDVESVRALEGTIYDARIKAPLIVLMGMVDASYDGDALFFSRDLSIEGDTGAVLALRNAMEDAEFDPASVIGLPDQVQGPFNRAIELALSGVRQALGAPETSGLSRMRTGRA